MATKDGLEAVQVARDEDWFAEGEQKKLAETVVGIAGTDGSGIHMVEHMARFGFNHLLLNESSDSDLPDRRQESGSSGTDFTNRLFDETVEQIKLMRPEIKLVLECEALRSQASAARFSEKCEITIDTMDSGRLRGSIFLQRAARQKGIFYLHVKAVGYGARVIIFNPFGITLEEYYCLPADLNLSETPAPYILQERFLSKLPGYLNQNMGFISDLANGPPTFPTNEIGRALASILATTEVVNIILRKRKIPAAPSFIYTDLMDQRMLVRSAFP